MNCKSPLPYSINSCSGNGYICSMPDVGCICNNGWTSMGDYSLDESDCLINYEAVRVLSYFCIIIPWMCNILIIRHYINMGIWRRKFFSLFQECKTVFPFCFLIMGISCANLGILKLSYPNGQQPLAGRDLSVSLTVMFSECSYFFGTFFLFESNHPISRWLLPHDE
jgi:hypothetical protein